MAQAKKNGKEESKEVVSAVQGGELMEIPANWGNEAIIPQSERLIPKLHLMQGQSKLVGEEKAKMGDIANLVTGEVLGDGKDPVEIIPVKKLPSTWVVYDTSGKDREFEEIVEVGPENANWEWEVKDAKGNTIRENDYCINFLVLAAKDPTFPFVVSFKRTSVKAGKKVVNHFDRCQVDKVAPARYALKLTSNKMTNDKGQPYYVFDILPEKRQSTDKEFQLAYQWYKTFQSQEIKVDHRDLEEDATPAQGAPKAKAEVNENSQY